MLVYQGGADIKEYMYIRTMNRNVSRHRSGNEEEPYVFDERKMKLTVILLCIMKEKRKGSVSV